MNSKHWLWDAPSHYIWRGVAIFLVLFWSLIGYGIASCTSVTVQVGKDNDATVTVERQKLDRKDD